jgi:pyruvate dehydrogenase E2 component (dihydrolipoamide acetyltransferase)
MTGYSSSWKRNIWLSSGKGDAVMDILMPQLGETVTEGTIITWCKREGDAVQADDVLLEIETDKASTEVPAPTAGVLARILVTAGQTVAVGTTLAVLETAEVSVVPLAQLGGTPTALVPEPTVAVREQIAAVAVAATATGRWVREPKLDPARQPLSPSVRRLLREHLLDPAQIVGGGRNGRIRRSDILARVQSAAPTANVRALGERLVPFNRMRKRTAEHMVRSKSTSPHVLQAVEVDFSAVVAVREKYKADWLQRYGVKLTFLPFVAHATCRALAEYPALNASIEGEALRVHADVNLAIAVDLNFEGLVAPVLPRVQALTLAEIAVGIQAMTQRVRSGKFNPDELKGGTYTLSNSGSFGTLITAPIINQPQVAILSVDGIHKRATVIESEAGDSIAIRPIGVLAQSFDHRAVDGAYSAAYLRTLKGLIEARDWESFTCVPQGARVK